MTELANCVRCDAVFVKTARDICPDCYRKEEEDFQKVYKFLSVRKNREATIPEIVDATKVDEETIFKFMKEGRLRASDFPKLSYPCEKCGVGITEGNLCFNCTESLKQALEQHELETELLKKREQAKKEEQAVYYTLDRNKED